MTLVRPVAALAAAAIPLERLSIEDVIPARRAWPDWLTAGERFMPDKTRAKNQSEATPRAKPRAPAKALSIAYPDACGIDIGSRSHVVAVLADRDDEPVREFAAFTDDLSAWCSGCATAASRRSRWSPPACTGSPCTRCPMAPALRCSWSMRATSRAFPGAGATCSTASGCSS